MCGIRWILQELKQNLAKELDFRLEARNAERLSSCMAGLRRVAIPKPVPQVLALSPPDAACILPAKSFPVPCAVPLHEGHPHHVVSCVYRLLLSCWS